MNQPTHTKPASFPDTRTSFRLLAWLRRLPTAVLFWRRASTRSAPPEHNIPPVCYDLFE